MSFKESTINSEMKYKGSILNLRVDEVKTVNGKSKREIIEHSGGAVIAPLLPTGHMVMVKQFRKALEREVLEVPAGKIDPGETPYMTAYRELAEETGYRAENLRFITKILPSVGYTTETLHLYLATGLVPGETDFDENEYLDLVTYHIEDLVEMVMEGKIQDAKSQIAILMTNRLVEKGEVSYE